MTNQTTILGKLVKIAQLTSTIKCFTIQTKNEFNFIPGQYIMIQYQKDEQQILRHYSLIQTQEKNQFKLVVKIVDGGALTPILDKFKISHTIEFLGPFGNFTFKDKLKESIFVASGTGISTLIAIINDALKKGMTQPIRLIFGAKNEDEILFENHFRQLENEYSNFKYTIVLSQKTTKNYQKCHVQDVFQQKITNGKDKHLYICGPPKMVESVEKIALKIGFKDEDIFYEKY